MSSLPDDESSAAPSTSQAAAAPTARPASTKRKSNPRVPDQFELNLPGDATDTGVVARKMSVIGWHGLVLAKLEIDWRLAAKLAPYGVAVKVVVAPRSPARKVGLRSGDYVISASPSPNADMPLLDFDATPHPAGSLVYVKYHRPAWRNPRHIVRVVLELRAPPGPPKQKWWQRLPRCECGEEVVRDKRKSFLGQMAANPHIKPLGVRILTRMLHHYQGRLGIVPSYGSIAKDLRLKRRETVIEHVHALEWIGVLEVMKGAGVKTRDGKTNAYRITWPAGWNLVSFPSDAVQDADLDLDDPRMRRSI